MSHPRVAHGASPRQRLGHGHRLSGCDQHPGQGAGSVGETQLCGAAGRTRPPIAWLPLAPCPACQLENNATSRAIKTLLKHINDPAIAQSYVAAGGLCLPHFTETLSHAGGGNSAKLREWQAAVYRELRDELDELIRKHDHRFRGETITEREAVAWTRAVAAVVGEAVPNGKGVTPRSSFLVFDKHPPIA